MKKSGRIAATSALCLLAGAAVADTQDRILTILTSPEPQTQLMAMVLTMQAAQQGADAHIMLCGPAADIALRNAPESATAGATAPRHEPAGSDADDPGPNRHIRRGLRHLPARKRRRCIHSA